MRLSDGKIFAASIGLTPRSSSSGGKEKLGSISRVEATLNFSRALLVIGAMAILSVLEMAEYACHG
nr:transposase [Shinella sp.]